MVVSMCVSIYVLCARDGGGSDDGLCAGNSGTASAVSSPLPLALTCCSVSAGSSSCACRHLQVSTPHSNVVDHVHVCRPWLLLLLLLRSKFLLCTLLLLPNFPIMSTNIHVGTF